jgi:uncharacterized delta-60 repeat protein
MNKIPSVDWSIGFDSGFSEDAHGVATDSADNVIVTGQSNSDYYTIKYDSSGNEVWNRVYDGGSTFDEGGDVAVDSEDNVIVTGRSRLSGDDDYFTIKYDSNGNWIWSKAYDGGKTDIAWGVAVDSADNVIVTGQSEQLATPSTTYDYFTIKYDSNGNHLWNVTYDGGVRSDYAYDVAVDSADNVIVTGASNLGDGADFYTVKYDSNGNQIWDATFNGAVSAEAWGVAVDSADNVVVTGYTETGDYLTVKYDSNGNLLWSEIYDGGSGDHAFAVAVDSADNVIVTGESTLGGDYDYYTIWIWV